MLDLKNLPQIIINKIIENIKETSSDKLKLAKIYENVLTLCSSDAELCKSIELIARVVLKAVEDSATKS